jgi:heterodisulfide reductase subunit A2
MSREERVAVIGAGPAGLAAALALADAGVAVVLAEAEEAGGHPREYGCVATDRCASCSACLTLNARREALEHRGISLIRPLGPIEFASAGASGTLKLGSDGSDVDGVILATGFVSADVSHIRTEYGYGRVPGVSTVHELERRFRSGALAADPPASLAFLQCVGSRDRAIGRDYCSRVCCTYALRLARAIHYRIPEIALTIFYQDLTPATPDFAELVAECQEYVRFVRALPAKVYQAIGAEGAVVCYLDTLRGPDAEQVEETFSEVALSVGMWPRVDEQLDSVLALERDEWGFVRGSRLPSVYPAGAATGPMTIAEAVASGRAAAAHLLRELRPGAQPKVALVSSDERVERLAREEGLEPVAAETVTGVAGALHARMGADETEVGGALIGSFAMPSKEETGLPAHVRSLWSGKARERAAQARNVVLMPDLYAPFSRYAHEVALRLAAGRSSAKQRTWYLMRHAFPGEMGLEQLLTKAREAGTVFTVCAEPPAVDAEGIEYIEPTLGKPMRVKAEIVLAAPPMEAPEGALHRLMELGLAGADGALLAGADPHLGLSGTRRIGYHLAGFTRDPLTSEQAAERAVREALAEVLLPDKPGTAEVDRERCAICLTCVRACPHQAPQPTHDTELDHLVSFIQPEACVGCGICVTVCPAEAISLEARTSDAILAALEGRDG